MSITINGDCLHRIYQIVHIPSGRRYVGCTMLPIEHRLRDHRQSAVGGIVSPLYDDMRAFNRSEFSIHLVEEVWGRKAARVRESFWMKETGTIYPHGYNLLIRHRYFENRLRHGDSRRKSAYWPKDDATFQRDLLLIAKKRARDRLDTIEAHRLAVKYWAFGYCKETRQWRTA